MNTNKIAAEELRKSINDLRERLFGGLKKSLDELKMLLVLLEESTIVCTFEVVSVLEITNPTNPSAAITVMFSFIPLFFPAFITIVFE